MRPVSDRQRDVIFCFWLDRHWFEKILMQLACEVQFQSVAMHHKRADLN